MFRAFILISIGELEARSGVRDRWRRHFDAAKAIIDDLGLQWPLGASTYPVKLGSPSWPPVSQPGPWSLLRWSCSTLDRLGDLSRLATVAPLTARRSWQLGSPTRSSTLHSGGATLLSPTIRTRSAMADRISGLRSHQGHHDEAIALGARVVALLVERVCRAARARAPDARKRAHGRPATSGALAPRTGAPARFGEADQAAMRTIEAFIEAGG